MASPEVSVVVPVYNGETYLRPTLDSILQQSFTDFELLVIDDGSKDGSAAVVHSLHDSRVRLIQQENRGLCHSLNRGIAEARGTFLARCDQDDISFPFRLERQHRVMLEHPEAVWLLSHYTKFGGKHRWANTDKLTTAAGQVKVYEPMADGCLLASTMFLRTAALREIGGFRQAYYPTDDWDLETRLAQAGTLLVLQEPVVAYRFHEGANTYPRFAEMQDKIRWTADSYRRRESKLPERSFTDFLASEPKDTWSRFRRYRRDSAKLYMRKAGQSYLDGRYLKTAARLSAATALAPENVFKRITRMLGRSK